MYTKQILSSTTSIQTKYLTNGPKFILDFKKASQSGRSMVEMLGVLGIIGLLSVGGISTYRYLFSVSEANKISNKILTDYNRLISTAGRRLVVPEGFSEYAFVLGEDKQTHKQTLTVTVPDLESEVAQDLMTNMGTMVSGLDETVDDVTKKSTVTLIFDIPNRRGGGRVNRPLIPDNAYLEEDDKGNLYQTSCPSYTLRACTQVVAGRDGCNYVQDKPNGMPCGEDEEGICFYGVCHICPTAITDEQLKKGICSIETTAPCTAATLTAEGEPCGNNDHGTCRNGVCECDVPWEGVDCSYCPPPWTGEDCATCGLDCQNDGKPNEDCSACVCPSNRTGDNCETCANSWTGDNCEKCGLDCQNDGTPNENCSACKCSELWDGANCTICRLQQSSCTDGMIVNTTTCACECPVGSDGKQMVLVNGTCVNYSSVCGSTVETCKAACPDRCEVSSDETEPYVHDLFDQDSSTGYICSFGECYCPARGVGFVDGICNGDGTCTLNGVTAECNDYYDGEYSRDCGRCSDFGSAADGWPCGGIGGFVGDWGSFCQDGECRGYFSGEIEDYPYDRTCASCFPSGTMISLADGTCKRVEDIDYDDELLVWDFDNGCFSSAKPLWIKQDETADEYEEVTFSNGATLGTINSHRVFNKEKGKFSYPITDEMPCYSTTFTADGTEVKVLDKKLVRKEVVYYNVITKHHMNCFANGILTSCRLSNLYPIQDMKYVKDNRALRPMSDYPDVPKEWYDGLRLAEQPVEINRDGDIKISETLLDYIYTCLRNDKCTLEDAVKVA